MTYTKRATGINRSYSPKSRTLRSATLRSATLRSGTSIRGTIGRGTSRRGTIGKGTSRRGTIGKGTKRRGTIRSPDKRRSINTLKKSKCMHWFRINVIDKVDCLLKDKTESDTQLKQLIGSAQNTYRGNYRTIVEEFLSDNTAFKYFSNKSNKEKASLLGFFMILQGGEYGASYGLPSQKWLNVCVTAKRKSK